MRKALLCLLCLSLCATAQDSRDSRCCQRGEGCLYAYREATTLSMVGWGFGLAIGIAALCALIENETSTSH
jgi:hypothetical protein